MTYRTCPGRGGGGPGIYPGSAEGRDEGAAAARPQTTAAAPLYRPLTRREIAVAVPAGSRRARGQVEFLHTLGTDPELAQLRADRLRNIAEISRVLARFASWRDRTTRPTRARICRLAAVSVSTFKTARQWLEQHGYLGTVRQGRTAALRAAVLVDADTPNEAAVWVLCVPRQKPRQPLPVPSEPVTRPLTASRSEAVKAPAREAQKDARIDDGSPAFVVAYLRSQVAELARGPGHKLSERYVLAISRPFLAARWSPADLAFAIGHDPVRGRHRIRLANVRQPAHWLAWRLSRWLEQPERAFTAYKGRGHWDHEEWPVPVGSPSSARAAAAEADRQAQAARRAQLAAAARTDPAPFADRIRQQLGWKKASERKPI
jgi:hypothetical protein